MYLKIDLYESIDDDFIHTSQMLEITQILISKRNILWYIFEIKYYSAIKRNKLFKRDRVNSENII